MNILEQEQQLDLPLLVPKVLEGSPPAQYSPVQLAFLPWVDEMLVGWWIVWVLVLSTVIYKGLQRQEKKQ